MKVQYHFPHSAPSLVHRLAIFRKSEDFQANQAKLILQQKKPLADKETVTVFSIKVALLLLVIPISTAKKKNLISNRVPKSLHQHSRKIATV